MDGETLMRKREGKGNTGEVVRSKSDRKIIIKKGKQAEKGELMVSKQKEADKSVV